MTLREIIDLQQGDVIPVDLPELLTLKANGLPIFKTTMGVSRGNLGLKIEKRTNIDEAE